MVEDISGPSSQRFDVALCEEVLVGALLYGDRAALKAAREGIAWSDEWQGELAEALLDFEDGGGDFAQLHSLIVFLSAMGLARTQSAREWMEDAMQAYRDWRSGLWESLPSPVRAMPEVTSVPAVTPAVPVLEAAA